ncbi:MAG: ATP-binding protein [Syntrophobacteraceae bacterium]
MKIESRHKIFLAFLLNSAAIVLCILLIGSYYGARHFRGYLARVEAARVSKLADVLGREYGKRGNWQEVLKNPVTLMGLRWFGPGMPPPPPPRPDKMSEAMGPPPPPPGTRHDHPPFPPLALFDAGKRPLVPPEDVSTPGSYRFTPVKANGRVVGWLGLKKFGERPTHPLDVEFLKRQSETFCATGLAVLVLAGLATFVLSRRLLAPVRELERGTRALSARRFDTRIAVGSDDELGRLAGGFNAMARALEKHQKTQQQWLVDISHELRTPLAILRAEIEAMQDGVRGVTEQGLESLHQEVVHLSRIVGDLHDLSLIEAGSLRSELVPVNPIRTLTETLDLFRRRLELRGIGLELQNGAEGTAVWVLADPDRLKQLFSNIFENTLRYCNVPGRLTVSYRAEGGELRIGLADSGPGVPEEALPRLFDRLYRVDGARSRESGGSGLGLAICKSIVESFAGRIEASNCSGAGLKIDMSFPLHSGPKE